MKAGGEGNFSPSNFEQREPMKIAIGTNLLANVDAEVYANHFALAYRTGIMAVQRGWNVFHAPPQRLSIDRMRNVFAAEALKAEADYLVFIDDDMLVHPDTIAHLIDADQDIIMAHTYIRGYPFKPMSFIQIPRDDPKEFALKNFEEIDDLPIDQVVVPCDAVGFACVAIKVQLLKDLEPPWFVTGINNTEDIYFCARCHQDLPYKPKVAVHRGVPTRHRVNSIYVGAHNVAQLREERKPPEAKADRGTDYYRREVDET